MTAHELRYWGFGPASAEEQGPQRVEIPVNERGGLSSSLAQFREDIEEFKREQRKEFKGIKKYMYTCFKKIGDALGVSIPPCGRSLDKDVSPPQPPARD